jgi:hypothetical protein
MTKSGRFNLGATPIAITALLFVLIAVVAGTGGAARISQKDQGILEKVKHSTDLSVEIDRTDISPLTISEATAKEITDSDYSELTGEKALSLQNTTFPNLKLTNGTSQKITEFALLCKNNNTGRIYFLKIGKITIAPLETYYVYSRDWLTPTNQIKADSEGKISKERSNIDVDPADLNTPEIWVPGRASDLIVKLGMVKYENGDTWMMDRAKSKW